MLPIYIIAALDKKNGIGRCGRMPWDIPSDLRRFKETTARGKLNAVVMGRRTWESLPDKYRPLPGRINFVITSREPYPLPEGVIRVKSLRDAVKSLNENKRDINAEAVFIIGGASVYKEAVDILPVSRIYITRINRDFNCDVFFPDITPRFIRDNFSSCHCENGVVFYFEEYVSK